MDRKSAEEFWNTYFGLIMHDGAASRMGNPCKEFEKQARIGEFDTLTDKEYYDRFYQVKEISTFWNNRSQVPAGRIFLEALSKTPLSHKEQKEIIATLVDASERIQYSGVDTTDFEEIDFSMLEEDEDFEKAYEETPFDEEAFHWTPRVLYDYIGEYIFGQEKAKKAAALLVYHHLMGHRRNMILAGPTGCGKTEIWRTLSRKFDFIKIINGPQLACDGWKGSYHIKDIFLDAMQEGMDVSKLLIVIDEADKLFEPAVASGGTDFSKMIQNEFLKIMDGDTVTFAVDNAKKAYNQVVDCSKVSFVFCGSFETLLQNRAIQPAPIGFMSGKEKRPLEAAIFTEEDLVQYGNVRREIAGRIQQIAEIEMLSAEDFERMMDSQKKMSPIKQIENLYRVKLDVDKATRRYLAHKAAESKLGCRYIRSRLQTMLDEQMFDAPDQKEFSLSIETAENVNVEEKAALAS